MKKILSLIIMMFSIISFATSSDEYTVIKETKNYSSVMRIIVKNEKIVSVSFERKTLDSKSWTIDNDINQEYKNKYGETYREMKTKLVRASQSKDTQLPEIGDKQLYNEFKEMFEYLLEKIVEKKYGSYTIN